MKEELFKNQIKAFKKLTIKEKKEITIKEMKEIIAVLEEVKAIQNINSDIMITKDVIKNKSIDEFTETVYIYTCAIQESLGEILNSLIK